MSDLEQLMPVPAELVIHGETLTVKPLKVGQLPAFLRAVSPIMQDLASPSTDWLTLLAERGNDVLAAIAIATGKPRPWVDDLGPDDAILLAAKVIEVNADFFTRTVMPKLDGLFGQVIIADAPDDPHVSVTLFTTASWIDRRNAARDRIERYLARGVKWPGQLLERQLTGQRAIALLLKPSDPLPRVGQALVLVQDEAKPTEVEQYVRITRITTTEREFTVSDSGVIKFKAIVATCELSDPLRFDFEGPAPSERDDLSAKAVVRDTVVANAAVYFGIQPTVAEARIGDIKLQVASLFGQLVPSAQSETPLVDLTAAGQSTPVVDAAAGVIQFTANASIGPNLNLFLGNGCVPGTLRISVAGTEIVDAGGQLKAAETVIGSIDYGRGVLTFAATAPQYDGSKNITFRPAAAPVRVADTAAIAITPDNRGYAYTITLNPPPQPGSLMVSYMAQGKWYDLRDNGDRALRGADSAYGAGSVDYVSGSVILTTGALPDANTEILFAWGTAASYFNRAVSPVTPPGLRFTTANPGIVPGSLVITWTDGQSTQQAADDAHGNLIGDAQGTVRYAQGEVTFTPLTLPAGGAQYQVTYEFGVPLEENFPHPLRNSDSTVTVNLARTDIRRGSVELEFNLLIENYTLISQTPAELQVVPRIDPVKISRDNPETGAFGQEVNGAIDYATGAITFTPDTVITVPKARYDVQPLGWTLIDGVWKSLYRNLFSKWEYVPAGASMPIDETGYVKVRYRAADSPNHAVETITTTDLQFDLTDRFAERIVPGSVRFMLGGKTYIDRMGSLVTDIDPATGAGALAGTVDYASGKTQVKVWQPGAANNVTLQSLLTELTGQPVDEVTFRIPAAPVRPGSVQLRAVPLTGGTVSATASGDGGIAAATMQGKVDYQTGVVRVRFGQWVTAAGYEDQIWYSADAVIDGKIFKPLPVFADTIRFNAVAYTYLPLSADVLGLDPVRLPLDGRVPIYRPGDVAVVHHTARTAFPSGAAGGDTLDVGRVRLAALRLLDAEDNVVPADRYTVDLDAGTVTLKSPLNLAGFTQPLYAEHRIEDMGLISDVQINGVLTLTRPLTHDYPAQASRVSSALIIGDLQARAHTLFTQQTWTGEWRDTRIGANTIAQYNEAVYPIAITNRGAIEERWALIFTNTNEFRVIGESVGQIAIGNTAVDLAPMNPETHAPYFTLYAAGLSAGWSAGNVLRFNTAAANFPVWIARTVLQGPATTLKDTFQLQIRGDIDR
jgi:hypothetical protein